MIPAALLALILSGTPTITDGDTIHVGGERARLIGIDSPESGQTCNAANGEPYDCGVVATQALHHIIGGRSLTCSYTDRDRYNRPLVTCQAQGDLLSINEQMVMRGWAVALDYGPYTSPYRSDEDLAHSQHLGIWSGAFERPADWRREHRIPSRN